MSSEKTPCAACHGTGQWTFFGGVSRFFFTVEECPECAGLGFILTPEKTPAPTTQRTPAQSAPKSPRTRRKK